MKVLSYALLGNAAFTGTLSILNIFFPRLSMFSMLRDSIGSKTAFSSDEYFVLSGLLGAVSMYFSFMIFNLSLHFTLSGLMMAGWANLIIAAKGFYNLYFYYDSMRYIEMGISTAYLLFGLSFLINSSPYLTLPSFRLRDWYFSNSKLQSLVSLDILVTLSEGLSFLFLYRTSTWMLIKGYPFTLASPNDERIITMGIASFFFACAILQSHIRFDVRLHDMSWLTMGHLMYALAHCYLMWTIPSSRTLFHFIFLMKDLFFTSVFGYNMLNWPIPAKKPIRAEERSQVTAKA